MAQPIPRPGGFCIRFVAFGIDVVVVMLAQFLLSVLAVRRWGVDAERSSALQGAVVFFTMLFAVLYPTVLYTLTGQTVGKLLVGVRVVATDGELLPAGAALLRALVHWFSLAVMLGLGHVLAGRHPGRTRPEQIILVNPFGMALEDIALAAEVARLADKLGIGRRLTR